MSNKNISYERYSRQLLLKEFGEAGQQKLLNAKVLVIGAGGLGCPVLQYLTAAGIGTIGIIDDDVVSLSNLQRQVLYSVADIGFGKAERAAALLQQLNPEINLIPYSARLIPENALEIISGFDIVVDGTDNFSTRYMINDACVLLNKPLIYGAISSFEGQVAIFNCEIKGEKPVNYRDLFPDPPKEGEVLNCAEAGVLGVLPGIIGSMMASETIKLITGIGKPLINSLLSFNALNNQFYEFKLTASVGTDSLIPANANAFKATDYEWLCAAPASSIEIDMKEFDKSFDAGDAMIIDVREEGEMPAVTEFEHQKMPLSILKEKISMIVADRVVIFCQSGIRSLQAAKELQLIFGSSKNIYSLKGGIVRWKELHQKKMTV